MKPVTIIGSIILVVFIISLAYIVVSSYPGEENTPIDNPDDPDEEIGFYSQKLIVNYQDGTRSDDLAAGWLYHDNKKIDDFTYELYVTPEEDKVTMNVQFYYFEYTVSRNNEQVRSGQVYFSQLYNQMAEGKTLIASDTFDPFNFINYTYPDGSYTIKLIPSGDIMMDGELINLPNPFSFTIELIDERSVDVNFG